jgi:hypothetical protein
MRDILRKFNFDKMITRRAGDLVQDMLSVNFEMYKQVNDHPDFAEGFLQFLRI